LRGSKDMINISLPIMCNQTRENIFRQYSVMDMYFLQPHEGQVVTGFYTVQIQLELGDGNYTGQNDHKLFAFNPESLIKWEKELISGVPSIFMQSPAVANDRTIYIADFKNFLLSILKVPSNRF